MRVFFRADASIQIGSGHIMRCLTLADELKTHGAVVKFITRMHIGNLADIIEKRGYELCLLPVNDDIYRVRKDDVVHATWLGVSWEQDAEESRLAIGDSNPEWLVVDHYGIDTRWHRKIRNHVGQIMVIDDLSDRPFACDMLLDQTYGRQNDDYQQLVPSNCQMLLGSRYAMLRPEFSELRPIAIEKRMVFNGINRILVSMGGMDSENITATVLDGISKVNWKLNPVIDVVLGGNAPHLQQIVALAEKSNLETSVSTDVTDMADRMLAADLAIGAGGSTSWERCCLGLPSLTVTSAKNQRMVVHVLSDIGAIRQLGVGRKVSVLDIKQSVERLVKETGQLGIMSQAGFRVTDGQGAKRTVLEMMPPCSKDGKTVKFRPFTYDDAELVFKWQSDVQTRKYFNIPKAPTFKEHTSWVAARLKNTLSYTEIILHGNEPAGVLRLDAVNDTTYMVSIYVEPDKYGKGVGKTALGIVVRLMYNSELRAEIHKDNMVSKKLFEHFGFVSSDGYLYVRSPMGKFEN